MNESQNNLLDDIQEIVEQSRSQVAVTANAVLTNMYWKIGERINKELLNDGRATYGKEIVSQVATKLQKQYGKQGFQERNIRRMMQFSKLFPDFQIVSQAATQLSWSHFIELLPIKDDIQREFYLTLAINERWGRNVLRNKINGMLFERTAISKKPDQLIKKELKELREDDKLTPDLVFRSPYFLDFLGLKDTYSERDLENAILHELEGFILELGQGFAFVERQKRMIIDGEDFKLDLLFFHRKLRRLVAIDLKLGKFKPEYKGKMELYLRWLEKNEIQEGENLPIGLLLCTEGNKEQIELLQLEKAGIKVAEYLTELPSKKLLQQKLNKAVEISKRRIDDETKK